MPIDIVQEIKLRTDLVELISAYVPLRRSGRTYKGLCPFHAEKTPSFHVDPERGFYRCYGCGASGDCFSFLQQREGLSFTEAGEMLARRLGLEWVRAGESAAARSLRQRLYDVNALAERFFRDALAGCPEARDYLSRRGLDPDTIERFRIGYAPPGYDALLSWLRRQRVSLDDALAADLILRTEHGLRDRFVDRLIIPIADVEGRVIAFGGRALRADTTPKYLNNRETPIFQKGKSLFALHLAREAIPRAGFAVVVEGYMDAIALHQAGIAQAVATLGTAVTETHVAILRRYGSELVLCMDGDSAGLRAALRSAPLFEAAGCNARVARLPEGEDPDTFVRTRGPDAFRSLLHRAEPLVDYQIDRLRAGYNLSDEKARLSFVREAARIIARSASHLTRQEHAARFTRLLDRLADEWYPGDPPRALEARLALRQEVNRILRAAGAGSGRPEAPGPPRTAAAPAAAIPARPAERYVLRAALTDPFWAERVLRRTRGDRFTEPALAVIAAALFGNKGEAEQASLAGRIERIRQDPEYAGIVGELLLDPEPLTEEGLERSLAALERAWKQNRLRELRRAQEEEGFAPGDPRGEELRRLVAELGGWGRRED